MSRLRVPRPVAVLLAALVVLLADLATIATSGGGPWAVASFGADALGPAADDLRFTAPGFEVALAPPPDTPAVVTPTGVVLPVRALGASYLVATPCGAITSLAFDEAAPLYRADVVLDPGHGGARETGSVGANGLREADLNLVVAGLAREGLTALGYDVVLTRYADHRLPIQRRAEIANALGPAVTVSIHHNGSGDLPRSPTPGSEVFVQVGDAASARLGGLLYEEGFAALAAFDVPWVAGPGVGTSERPSEDGTDFFGMLRRLDMPTALTELAYLSNDAEARALALPEVQQAEADAIVRAVHRWFTTNDPGTGFRPPPFITRSAGGGGGFDACIDPPLR